MTNTAVVSIPCVSETPSPRAITIRGTALSCALFIVALLGAPTRALAVNAGVATEVFSPSMAAKGAAKGTAKGTPLRLPLHFEEAEDGRFVSRQGRYAIAIGNRGSVQFLAPGRKALEMSLAGAAESEPAGEGILPGHSNYFLGNDPSKWRRDVSHYSRTRVPAVYPGIDLLYYGNGSALEHDYILAPGADAGRIALDFRNGSAQLEAKTGDLLLQPQQGESFRIRRPAAYQQDADGTRHTVAAVFERRANGEFGFSLGAYDHRRELVIDPVLIYSTFFGGSNYDSVVDLKTDANGNYYFLMNTNSFDLPQHGNPGNGCPTGCGNANPTTLSDAPSQLNMDFYVAKLDAYGQTLDFATYIGGSGSDTPANLALDADGNVYIAGQSFSTNFPIMNAYQAAPSLTNNAPASGVLTKLSADGSTLLYSTYIGHGFPEGGAGMYSSRDIMSVDKAGVVYLLEAAAYEGSTPPQVPVNITGPMKNSLYNEGVSFLAKIDTTQSAEASLLYATLIGDNSHPSQVILPVSIGVDSLGDLWMYGLSGSTTFPVTSAASYQSTVPAMNAGGGAFLMELNPGGTAALYGTWLAGSTAAAVAFATPSDMTLDSADNIYVTGQTTETDYPLKNAAYGVADFPSNEFEPFYVSKLGPGGKQLLYSTFYHDYSVSVGQAVNFPISPFVHGSPTGPTVVGGFAGVDSGFPTKNSLPAGSGHNANNVDGVFSVFDSTKTGAESLLISSVLGSSSGFTDVNQAVIDGEGTFVVLGGLTSAADFPVASPYQRACNPQDCTPVTQSYESTPDGFLMRVQVSGIFSVTPTTIPFPDTAVGSSSAPMTARISNGTAQPISLGQMTSSDTNDFTSTTNCGTVINPFSSCTVTFTFTPKTSGALTSTFVINSAYSMYSTIPLQVALSGTGTGTATAVLGPNLLDFGSVTIGASRTSSATLTNSGSVALAITSSTVTGTGFAKTQDQCGTALAANSSCQIAITASPTAVGMMSGTLTVMDAFGTQTSTLIATGAASTSDSLSPSLLTFGTPTVSQVISVNAKFTNSGSQPITILGTSLSAAQFTLASTSCPTPVPAQYSCTFSLQFHPTGVGTVTGTFTVQDGASNPTIALTATAVPDPAGIVTLLPTGLNFVNVPPGQKSSPQLLTMNNGTTAPLTFTFGQIATSGPDAASFSFLVDNCQPAAGCNADYSSPNSSKISFTLSSGGSFGLDVTMGNDAQDLKTYMAYLSIQWNYVGDPAGTPTRMVTASLVGSTATPAVPSVTPSSISFPITSNGAVSAPKTVIISNGGEAPLGLTSVTITGTNAGAFTPTQSCPKSFNKGDTCTVSIVFAPGSTGTSFSANLDVSLSTGDVIVALAGDTTASDFTITSPNPTQNSSNASWTINVAPLLASVPWNQPVVLTASGLDPSYGVPTFSPNTVTPHGVTAISTLTLTNSHSSRLQRLPGSGSGWPVLACLGLLFPLTRRFRSFRGLRIVLAVACMAACCTMFEGCAKNPVNFTVTATSGSVIHTITLTLQP